MATEADERFLRLAIEKAREGMAGGGSPFGAVVTKDGEVVSSEHNVVLQTTDCTAHAEIHALRSACRALGDIDLAGCTVYSTTEPCPMCFAAIHWARSERIVFGTSIADAQAAGFHELPISNETMKRLGGSRLDIEGGILREECQALFDAFARQEGRRTY